MVGVVINTVGARGARALTGIRAIVYGRPLDIPLDDDAVGGDTLGLGVRDCIRHVGEAVGIQGSGICVKPIAVGVGGWLAVIVVIGSVAGYVDNSARANVYVVSRHWKAVPVTSSFQSDFLDGEAVCIVEVSQTTQAAA